MKKQDVSGFIVYVIIFTFAIVFGLLVLRDHAPKSSLGNMYILYVLGAIIVGLLFNAIIYEVGHIIGAKLGGYEIVSVAILVLQFYKKNGKFQVKFANHDGLTGETHIVPTEGKKCNPRWHLIMGPILCTVFCLVFIVLFIVLNNQGTVTLSNVGYFLLIVAVIGAMILIYNIMPFELDSITDGYRLRLIKNKNNIDAYNELLRVEDAIRKGTPNVEVKTFTEITNFTADLNLNKVYLLFNEGKLKEAEELIDIILAGANSLDHKVYIRAKAQKIYIKIMTQPEEEVAQYYKVEIPVEERRNISEDVSMPCIRAYMLMAGILDKSQSETELTLNKVIKAFKRTDKARQKIELKLYNDALNKIIEVHPKWGLEGYILNEVDEKK